MSGVHNRCIKKIQSNAFSSCGAQFFYTAIEERTENLMIFISIEIIKFMKLLEEKKGQISVFTFFECDCFFQLHSDELLKSVIFFLGTSSKAINPKLMTTFFLCKQFNYGLSNFRRFSWQKFHVKMHCS